MALNGPWESGPRMTGDFTGGKQSGTHSPLIQHSRKWIVGKFERTPLINQSIVKVDDEIPIDLVTSVLLMVKLKPHQHIKTPI